MVGNTLGNLISSCYQDCQEEWDGAEFEVDYLISTWRFGRWEA